MSVIKLREEIFFWEISIFEIDDILIVPIDSFERDNTSSYDSEQWTADGTFLQPSPDLHCFMFTFDVELVKTQIHLF